MRRTLLLFILSVCLITPVPAASGSVWTGGAKLSLDSSAALPEAEYLGSHVTVDPLQGRNMSPFISAGLLMPLFTASMSDSFIEVSGGLTLFHLFDHRFNSLFLRPSSYAPRISAGVVSPLTDPARIHLTGTIEPLSFFFGGRNISVLGFRLVFDPNDLQQPDWTVRLFDITYYLF